MSDMKARPTIYKGIRMRSRLEAGYARWLDETFPGSWHYEPCCFADDHGQYLPDFVVDDVVIVVEGTPRRLYIDVKADLRAAAFVGPPQQGTDVYEMGVFARMQIILESEPDAALAVASPENGGWTLLFTRLCPYWEEASWVNCPHPDGCHIPGLATVIEDRPWPARWWEYREIGA